MRPSSISVPAQLALGALVAGGTYGTMIFLAAVGVPLRMWAWVLVFVVIWIATFLALKKQMMAFLVSFVVTGGSIYLFLAARGFRV